MPVEPESAKPGLGPVQLQSATSAGKAKKSPSREKAILEFGDKDSVVASKKELDF